MKVFSSGRPTKPFQTDLAVDCGEVILRAVVEMKTVPQGIPLVERKVRPTAGETNGALIDEQHFINGRSARFDLHDLLSSGFVLAEVWQTETGNRGMRAVYFRLVRGGKALEMTDPVLGFFVKLSCAQWADAKVFTNPAIKNETGEVVVRANLTINTLRLLGGALPVRVFKFKVSAAAAAAAE